METELPSQRKDFACPTPLTSYYLREISLISFARRNVGKMFSQAWFSFLKHTWEIKIHREKVVFPTNEDSQNTSF